MKGALLAALAASALMLAGCGLQQSLSNVPFGNGPVGPAPPISAPTLTGPQYDWSATRGHVLVIDFWGSWCEPCRAEQPDLNKLVTDYASKGVVFVGVDLLDNNPAGMAYERTFNVTYPSVNDSSEVIASEYNVIDPPTVIIVDAKGNIVDRFLGTLSGVSNDLHRLLPS
jgi:thiol-disulfide isomerase/thioredoxin